ncbi:MULTISPECIES: hypothetical protein [Paenibacillus]|uniref:hypothetical protein n=1 Tax=Paenibacillus TaxID=44249 RepID=UPI002FE4154E
MKFKSTEDVKMIVGELIYTKDDYSFDFEPNVSADFAILIGYINITFDSTSKTAKQIWGCNPYLGWANRILTPPKAKQLGLMIQEEIESGDVLRLVEAGEWETYFDEKSGWVCIGDVSTLDTDDAIEFARGIVVVLQNGFIKSLWLRPKIMQNEVSEKE